MAKHKPGELRCLATALICKCVGLEAEIFKRKKEVTASSLFRDVPVRVFVLASFVFIVVYGDIAADSCYISVKGSFWFLVENLANSCPMETSCVHKFSHLMRKPTICICETKGADQLRSNCEADQRLCFRYTDSTIPLLSKSKICSPLANFCGRITWFVSDLVRNHIVGFPTRRLNYWY